MPRPLDPPRPDLWIDPEADDVLPPLVDEDEIPAWSTTPRRPAAATPATDRALGVLLGTLSNLDPETHHVIRHYLARRQALALHRLMGHNQDAFSVLASQEDEPGGPMAAALSASHPDLISLTRDGIDSAGLTTVWRRLRLPLAGEVATSNLGVDRPPVRSFQALIALARPRDSVTDLISRLLDDALADPDLDLDIVPRRFRVDTPLAGQAVEWTAPGRHGHGETAAAILPFFLPGLDPVTARILAPLERPPILLPIAAWILALLLRPDPTAEPHDLASTLEHGVLTELRLLRAVGDTVQRWRSLIEKTRRSSSQPKLLQLVAIRPILTAAQAARHLGVSHRGARLLLDQARDAGVVHGRDIDGIRRYTATTFLGQL